MLGQPQRAIDVMKESIRQSELSGFVVPQGLTRADLAAVYGSLGAIERGLETARIALTAAETHFPQHRVHVLGALAQLHLLHGDLAQAGEAIDLAKKDPNREAWPVYFVSVVLTEGELAFKQGDFERSLAVTDTLLADLRQFGMRPHIPSTLYLRAHALGALGQNKAARDSLQQARSEAEAIGSRRRLWPILFALSRLEPDPTEAGRLRRQAQEIVEYIANNINTPELRTSFLDLPYVRSVFKSAKHD